MVKEEVVLKKPSLAPIIWFSESPAFIQKYGLEVHETIQEVCSPLLVTDDQLREMMDAMLASMEEGLSVRPSSSKPPAVKMLPSYVRSVPNGTEKGNFLALDLGGTNFRVLLIRLNGKEAEMTSQIYRIPHELMVGSGQVLFDHIATCLKNFMRDEDLAGQKLPLGFTFSFPCKQEGLTVGKLINWTKGFKASGVEGEDIVSLLRDACKRIQVDIDVVALLNDTTGTLMACAHKENSCNVGVIVGTGTNACYMERIQRCPKLDGEIDLSDGGPDEMIINTEWGAFGDDGKLDRILTAFDKDIDSHSINPGKQLFEKMISGMYMGELVRLVVETLTIKGLLFEGKTSPALATRGNFPTKFVSEIESDLLEDDRTFTNTFNILEDLGLEHVSPADCANVAYVCSVVSSRAAHLCAAGIATLLNRMEKKEEVTVGVDGSVYRFHPTFKNLLDEKIKELILPGLKMSYSDSDDSSRGRRSRDKFYSERKELEKESRMKRLGRFDELRDKKISEHEQQISRLERLGRFPPSPPKQKLSSVVTRVSGPHTSRETLKGNQRRSRSRSRSRSEKESRIKHHHHHSDKSKGRSLGSSESSRPLSN